MTEFAVETAANDRALAREQFKSITNNLRRNWSRVLVCDLFLFWLLYRYAPSAWAWGWLIAITAVQAARAISSRRLDTASIDPADAMVRLDRWFLAVGIVRAAYVVLPFSVATASVAQHLSTVLLLGLAAGGVTSVGGRLSAYLYWGIPVHAALAAAWMWRLDFEGVVLGLLILWLASTLFQFVRDERRLLTESVQMRNENAELVVSLREARDTALLAVEARTRFFASASHGLRQPLHALSMQVATLGFASTEPKVAQTVLQLERSLGHANALLEGLIDMSRLDAHNFQPQRKHFPFSDIADALQTEFALDADRLGLELVVTPSAIHLHTDPDLLLRVLRNLVGNALRFTETGSVQIRAVDTPLGTAALEVRDTGIGIAPSEQVRVFEEFYQLSNSGRDRSKGLGLGLSIVDRICKLLGHRLTLESTPGVGSVFRIEVPLGSTTPSLGLPISVPPRSWNTLPDVLVVDDELAIVEATLGAFEHLGWTGRGATSSAIALALLAIGWRPTVLLIDMRLGGDNGLDLASEVHRVYGPTATIIVTGESSPAQLVALRDSGLAWVHKPINIATLIEVVFEQLKKVGVNDEEQSGVAISPGGSTAQSS